MLSGNIISGNTTAHNGGGICCKGAQPTVVNNTIISNSATERGGGLYCSAQSSVNVMNTIFWGNDAPSGPEVQVGTSGRASAFSISHSDMEGGQASVYVRPGSTLVWGPGMIDADPLFVEPGAGDYHLTGDSPCINAGDNNAPDIADHDFEGDPRIAFRLVDMGADEAYPHLYHVGDVIPGGSLDIRVIGIPKTGAMLCKSFGLLDPPWQTFYGYLYLEWPLFSFFLGHVPDNGVLTLTLTVPAYWSPGDEHYFQAFTGGVLTNLEILFVE